MSQAQKDFAFKCIDWGEKHYQMGHTLAAIAWMESSLGDDNEHKDNYSCGPFGLSKTTTTIVARGDSENVCRGGPSTRRIFQTSGRIAILIYRDNIRYIKQWHRNRGRSVTDREAWRLASQVYRDGTRWQRRKSYGKMFRQRVAFLKFLDKRITTE